MLSACCLTPWFACQVAARREQFAREIEAQEVEEKLRKEQETAAQMEA